MASGYVRPNTAERFISVKHTRNSGFSRVVNSMENRMYLRNSRELPWECDCRHFWRDLGSKFSPRFVRDAVCQSNTCWFGHYECVPQKYGLKVLQRLDFLDHSVAHTNKFSEDFAFTTINVTVNCKCTRSEA